MKNLLAQNSIPIAPPDGFTGLGRFGNPGNDAPNLLDSIISTVIGVMTAIAFIWFTIQLFIGALSWITSGGDKAKVEAARSKLTHSLIGLVIIISAIFLIDLVGTLFGFDILDIPGIINDLSS